MPGRWISAKEALPEEGKTVLATDGVIVEMAKYGRTRPEYPKKWWRLLSGRAWEESFGSTVKWWMPLPEPPMRKGEQKMEVGGLIERLLAYKVKTDDAEWSPRICVEAAIALAELRAENDKLRGAADE